ncbi:hypothetical protein C8Q80DRAFT_1274205 [Daedaleopsis nitida]|nr:hypothetical protein C8Q80DRAFT_1274205 [Daedaleopsis nitida]
MRRAGAKAILNFPQGYLTTSRPNWVDPQASIFNIQSATMTAMRWNKYLALAFLDYPVVIWATHRVGGIVIGANPAYIGDKLVYQIKAAKATFLFVHPDVLPVGLEAARIAGLPDDRIVLFDLIHSDSHLTVGDLVKAGLAQPKRHVEPRLRPGESKTKLAFLCICISSGTTGRPKAVMIPHYSLISNIIQMKQHMNGDGSKPNEEKSYTSGDVALGALPFYHIYGIAVRSLHFFLFCGISLVVVPRFTLEAAPLSAELMHQVARVLKNSRISQGWGLTETAVAVSSPQMDTRVGTIGSSGWLIPGVAVRNLKADSSWGGVNEQGELVVTGPSIPLGYLDNTQATEETFKDGWVHTGDGGYVDEKKDVFIIDRIKELIKVRGFQVAPAELEGHLLRVDHPDVADVCVVAAPDEYSGGFPFAFVALHVKVRARIAKDGTEEERVRRAIIKHVSDHKAHYKWLSVVEFVKVVPRRENLKAKLS